MKALMKVRADNVIHAPHLNTHGPIETSCGLTSGHWTSTDQVVSCQTCIRIMAAQVSKGMPYYRRLLQEALDAEFVKTPIKLIEPLNDSYDSFEVRWIKEKINELTEAVNTIIIAQEGV